MRFTDADAELERRLDEYVRRSGQRKGKAMKALIARGLDEAEGGIDLRALVPAVHDKLSRLTDSPALTPKVRDAMLKTTLECAMLLRKMVASTDMKTVVEAQANARAAFEDVMKDDNA